MRTTVETITPELAAKYLAKNTQNRNVRQHTVTKMTRDLQAGAWVPTHQGIAFSPDGTLLDGQHRLLAVIQAGVPLVTLVTRGLPPEAQVEMDGQGRRQAADFMVGGYANQRSSALRYLIATEALGWVVSPAALHRESSLVTTAQIHQADAEPMGDRARQFARAANAAGRNTTAVSASSILTAACLYPDTATEFLEGLETLEGLTAADPRRALIRFRGGEARRVQTPVATFAAIKAARAWNAGKPLTVIRWTGTETVRVGQRR